ELRGNIRRTALVLLTGFVVVAVALGYWQGRRGARTHLHPDNTRRGHAPLSHAPANPRVADARLWQPGGRIIDRTGVVLAESETTPQGIRRRYLDPSLVHTLG